MAARTLSDLCENVFSGVLIKGNANIDVRREHLALVRTKLTEDHFPDEPMRQLFRSICWYDDQTGDVLGEQEFEDLLEGAADAGTAQLLLQMYRDFASRSIDHDVFVFCIEQVRERKAARETDAALVTAVEVLRKGVDLPNGKELRGQRDARSYVLSELSRIDKDLSFQESPEGNMRVETEDMWKEYQKQKELNESGGFQGVRIGIDKLDEALNGIQDGDLALTVGYTSSGKALPLSAPVLTPRWGFVSIGQLREGDEIIDPFGETSAVTGVYPQDLQSCFVLTFTDGSSCVASGDHLWSMHLNGSRDLSVVTTTELKDRLHKDMLRPYVPEAWGLANQDLGVYVGAGDPYEAGLTMLNTTRISSDYMIAPADVRRAFLRGATNAYGEVQKDSPWWHDGVIVFELADRLLADDLTWMARSLGLVTHFHPELGIPYTVAVYETDRARLTAGPLPANLRCDRELVSVLYHTSLKCVCIRVSAKSELFVTQDFLPTHNTSVCIQLAWWAAIMQGLNVVYITTEVLRPQVRRKVISRHSCLPMFGLDAGSDPQGRLLPGGLNSRDIRRASLTPREMTVYQQVLDDMRTNPQYGSIDIVQMPRHGGIEEAEMRASKIGRDKKIGLLVMDYLQLFRTKKSRADRREEQSDNVRDAKEFATTFNDGKGVPIVSPWQVNRKARDEAATTQAYTLQSLSETAEASNTPDTIISVLEDMFRPKERIFEINLAVLKQRDGEITEPFKVDVDYATSRFGQAKGGLGLGGFTFQQSSISGSILG